MPLAFLSFPYVRFTVTYHVSIDQFLLFHSAPSVVLHGRFVHLATNAPADVVLLTALIYL